MGRYILGRVAALGFVLVGISVLTFGLGHFAPGDPATLLLQQSQGEPPTDEQVHAMRHSLGLDRPLLAQFVTWSAAAAHGDLGVSWGHGTSVASLLRARFPRTAFLALTAIGLTLVVAIPLGVLASHRPDSPADHFSRLTALVGASFPSFFIGYLLMYVFGVALHLLPVSGYGSFANVVLPAVTLSLSGIATLTRLTRSSLLDILKEPFIQTARAKGASSSVVLFGHGLRNALIPILSVTGLQLGHFLAGAVVVEWIFAWPGLGKLAVDAIYDRDYPLMQGFVLLTATTVVLTNLVTDLAYVWADPRVRLDNASGGSKGRRRR